MLDRIREIDITTIFANLLDNAAEAMGEGENRYFSLADTKHPFLPCDQNDEFKREEKGESRTEASAAGTAECAECPGQSMGVP